jgi:hypothetical protein
MRDLLVLVACTGQRLGDVCRLRWQSVDMAAGIIELVPAKTRRRKGEAVYIPILPQARAVLESRPGRKGYVLPDMAERYERDSASVSKAIQATFERAGIQTRRDNGRGRAIVEQARKHKGFKDTAYALEKIMPPLTDEESRYHQMMLAQMNSAYIDALEPDAERGRKTQEAKRAGTKATHAAAVARAEEIRREYSQIKGDNPEVPRYWYIAETVRHFQGARETPRPNYGDRTVKNATRGL